MWHNFPETKPPSHQEVLVYIFSPLLREGYQYNHAVATYYPLAEHLSGHWFIKAQPAYYESAQVIRWMEIPKE